MLDKRTNIMFNQNLWEKLSLLAEEKNTSVSQLIRDAVRQVYAQKAENVTEKKAFTKIVETRKKSKNKINYQELIDYDRKI